MRHGAAGAAGLWNVALAARCWRVALLPAPAPCALPHRGAQTVAVSLAAKHGRLDLALQVYRLMLQDGVHPKTPTFNACTCRACCWWPEFAGLQTRGACGPARCCTGLQGRLHPPHANPTRTPRAASRSDCGMHARGSAGARLPLFRDHARNRRAGRRGHRQHPHLLLRAHGRLAARAGGLGLDACAGAKRGGRAARRGWRVSAARLGGTGGWAPGPAAPVPLA